MGPDKPIIDITPEPAHPPGIGDPRGGGTGAHRSAPADLFARRYKSFAAILLLALAGQIVWYVTQPRQYRATGTILVSRTGSIATPVTPAEMESEAEIVRTQAVAIASGESAGAGPGHTTESFETSDARREAVRRKIKAEVAGNSQVLRISFTESNRREAVASANLLMDLYLAQRRRLLLTPQNPAAGDPEGVALKEQAEQAARELNQFDQKSSGAVVTEEYRARARRRASLESKIVDLRASIRGQEETLRSFRASGEHQEVSRTDTRVIGMRAELKELESELARLEKADAKFGAVAAEREHLRRRLELTSGQSDFVGRKLQEARLNGASVQAQILTRAEAVQIAPFEFTWWLVPVALLVAFLAAALGSWALELFDRPVYTDDDLAKVVGAPPVHGVSGTESPSTQS